MTDKALEAAAKALIDIDPCISGHHESHVALKLPYAKAAISAYLSALPGEAEVVMEQIAHKEQIGIWANELTSALSLSDFLREDWSFDDSVDLEKEVAAQLLDIIRSAITHPGLNLVASLQAMQARAEKAERESDYWQKLHDERTRFLGQCATEKEAAEARVKELEEALTINVTDQELVRLNNMATGTEEVRISSRMLLSLVGHVMLARTALKGGSNG